MSSSKSPLSPSDRKTTIRRGARMKRLREDADVLDREINRRNQEVGNMENELEMRKALIAAAEIDLQEIKRELAEGEQESNAIYGNDRKMASLMALDGGPSQLQPPKEDLDIKMKKVVSGGAAVSAVKMCTFCDVVCNSQTVFLSHLAGRKHATMVKKKGEAEV